MSSSFWKRLSLRGRQEPKEQPNEQEGQVETENIQVRDTRGNPRHHDENVDRAREAKRAKCQVPRGSEPNMIRQGGQENSPNQTQNDDENNSSEGENGREAQRGIRKNGEVKRSSAETRPNQTQQDDKDRNGKWWQNLML